VPGLPSGIRRSRKPGDHNDNTSSADGFHSRSSKHPAGLNHKLNVAATRIRSIHLQCLEAALKIPLPDGHTIPQFHTDAGIVYRPDNIVQKPRVRIIFALITSP
jgi:hypothetical protein